MTIKTDEISLPILLSRNIKIYIKRLDLMHPYVSGNKWFKLKHNFSEAVVNGYNKILTFGGAYSNHIFSTAYLAKELGLQSIGVIRGEEIIPKNYTLNFAENCNMKLHYLNRDDFRDRETERVINFLKDKFGDFYLMPLGGNNLNSLKGGEEIIEQDDRYDFICSSIGTGSTFSSITNASQQNQNILGFPAIRMNNNSKTYQFIKNATNKNNWKLIFHYDFGGFAKYDKNLINFIHKFYEETKIPLDIIYTAKMVYGVIDMVKKNMFTRNSKILLIHTGGLQGNIGFNERFSMKLPIS
ncbi:MAG: 1-aminocyclopropane-1-carboxylate deaminase [Flavobacteriales bacterium]|nr:1-aminocyclopropane-1-carboxylate deaminase [Flavobacteriales bacterium]|tara:strand:- start:490 stop:1383 length:894 start_codon:yes stop_codon:yes gene_type:complete